MSVKLLTEHHLEFLSLNVGCTDSFESTLVKMTHCWKSHVAALIRNCMCKQNIKNTLCAIFNKLFINPYKPSVLYGTSTNSAEPDQTLQILRRLITECTLKFE